MEALLRLTAMEVRLFFREKETVFWTFLFPVLIIWLFGSMFGEQKFNGRGFAEMYIPAWIGANLLSTALFGVGTILTQYREQGVLRRLRATPVRPVTVMTAHLLQGALVFLISALILVGFGMAVYDLRLPLYPGSFLAAVGLAVFALYPFAIFATSFAKDNRSSAAISSVLLNVMLFLSGATFPLEMMPEFIRQVAKILPLYYVVDLFQATWNGSPLWENTGSVGVLAGIAVVFTYLAVRFFRWTSREM
ncbi:ABC transporter permease [Kroppenstedtia eburnea]|uniref:ABC transporter permease n=1 Tax=Kroppenstedtia eburnea TaxID=714067 RepID=UPI00363A9B31